MLTIQILIKNNKTTIESCINSIQFDCHFIFGNMGSEDGTENLCKKYGEIVNVSGNFSEMRNGLCELSNTEWNFWIDPWEKIISGQEQILWAINQNQDSFNILKVNGNVISKPIRLWKKNKLKFNRPVYENLEPDNLNQLSCVISGDGEFDIYDKLIEWKKNNINAWDIDYYLSLYYLNKKKYNNFISLANNFIFKNPNYSSTILLRYYLANVYLFVKKNADECYRHILVCLSQKPEMAEFWSLLGDLFFAKEQWKRASAFYDNAAIFGKYRKNDSLPIDISKYKDYPDKMIEKCVIKLRKLLQ